MVLDMTVDHEKPSFVLKSCADDSLIGSQEMILLKLN